MKPRPGNDKWGHSALIVVAIGVLVLALSSSAFQFKSRYLQRHLRRGKSTTNSRQYQQSFATPLTQNTVIRNSRQGGEGNYYKNSSVASLEARHRSKRATYAWPASSLFIAQFSLEIPLYTPDGVGIPFLVEVPFEFDLPNVTESIVTARSERDRLTFFGTIESLFSRFGYKGETCMLRAICERAETDVLTKGILGEVLNIVLAVSSSGLESNRLDHYKEAEFHGRDSGGCEQRYADCPISIFHFFN